MPFGNASRRLASVARSVLVGWANFDVKGVIYMFAVPGF
jgi:hypothetical protein